MSEYAGTERRKSARVAVSTNAILQLIAGEQARGERHEQIIAEMQRTQAATAKTQAETAIVLKGVADIVGEIKNDVKCHEGQITDLRIADAKNGGVAGKPRSSWLDDAGTKKIVLVLGFLLIVVVLGLIAGVTIWRDFASLPSSIGSP